MEPSDCYWYDYYEDVYIGMVGSSYMTGIEAPTSKKARKRIRKKEKRTFGFSQALENDKK